MSSLVDLRHLVILKKSELDALQREYDCFEALEEECDEKAEAADRVIEELWGWLSTRREVIRRGNKLLDLVPGLKIYVNKIDSSIANHRALVDVSASRQDLNTRRAAVARRKAHCILLIGSGLMGQSSPAFFMSKAEDCARFAAVADRRAAVQRINIRECSAVLRSYRARLQKARDELDALWPHHPAAIIEEQCTTSSINRLVGEPTNHCREEHKWKHEAALVSTWIDAVNGILLKARAKIENLKNGGAE